MDDDHAVTRFGLIRHAETIWNREKRIQGHSDSPLTEFGRRSAQKWGQQLAAYPWDRMLISDLGRARATADRVNHALGLDIFPDAGLREQKWGLWEGKPIREVEADIVSRGQATAGWAFCPPEGEDRESVRRRGFTALRRAAAQWPGDTILVVAHEGMLKCLIYRLLGREFLPSEPAVIKSAHLHFLRYDHTGSSIEQINALALASYKFQRL